jgi:hypothetical protein
MALFTKAERLIYEDHLTYVFYNTVNIHTQRNITLNRKLFPEHCIFNTTVERIQVKMRFT